MHILKNTNYDFLRWRVHAIVVSWILIVAGIFMMVTKGIPKGVEFAGGPLEGRHAGGSRPLAGGRRGGRT